MLLMRRLEAFSVVIQDPPYFICYLTPPLPGSELKLLGSPIPIPFSFSSLALLSDLSLCVPRWKQNTRRDRSSWAGLSIPSLSPSSNRFRRQNVLTRALQEIRTAKQNNLHPVLPVRRAYQPHIGAHINKGEALHALRGFLFVTKRTTKCSPSDAR